MKGADILIVNPGQVALRCRPEEGDAPVILARGRNLWAKRMREMPQCEGIGVIRNPVLARASYHSGRNSRQHMGTIKGQLVNAVGCSKHDRVLPTKIT